jgi:hypothetical protein
MVAAAVLIGRECIIQQCGDAKVVWLTVSLPRITRELEEC